MKSDTKSSMWATIIGNQCHRQLFLDLWDLDFPEMGIVGAAIGTIVSCCHVSFMHYILIRKPKFHPYFENFSLKEIKKKKIRLST
jgi:MATE family multidrug resistance protein